MRSSDPVRPPDDLYLDTSVVVAAIIRGTLFHAEALALCNLCAAARCRIYYSQLLKIELLQAVRSVGTAAGNLSDELRSIHRLARWGRDETVRRAWMQFGMNQFVELTDQFSEVYEIPISDDIWVRSAELMVTYHLDSYDAVHAASALSLGVFDLATLDTHFTRIADLTVHLLRTPAPSPEQP